MIDAGIENVDKSSTGTIERMNVLPPPADIITRILAQKHGSRRFVNSKPLFYREWDV